MNSGSSAVSYTHLDVYKRQALDGARQILMEEFAENAELLARLREWLWDKAVLHSQLVEGKADEGAKFRDYFDYREALQRIPSHRALALFRGRNEGVLQLTLEIGDPTASCLLYTSRCV